MSNKKKNHSSPPPLSSSSDSPITALPPLEDDLIKKSSPTTTANDYSRYLPADPDEVFGLKKMNDESLQALDKRLQSGSKAGMWWTAALFIFLQHIVSLYILIYYPLPSRSIILLTFFHAWLNLLGITAGYHRLWSHRSYSAVLPLRIFLSIIGLTSFQGSIRWWVLRHRLHHRYTDTKLDPYDSTKGFWYSHIGWLYMKPPKFDKMNLISTADLDSDPVVEYQRKYLLLGYIVFGLLSPAFIGYLLGDAVAGALWIGGMGRVLSWHAIFSINSFSHWKGQKEYNAKSSAVSVALLGLIQNGEGYHNYHHEFPHDYRHGWRWYEWDPTKWCINLWHRLGLVSRLRTADHRAVIQSIIQVKNYEINNLLMPQLKELPPDDSALPYYSLDQFHQLCVDNPDKLLIILGGYIVDVTDFSLRHPAGSIYLKMYRGKDCSAAVLGGFNSHTNGSLNIADYYKIGLVDGDHYQEQRKKFKEFRSFLTKEQLEKQKQKQNANMNNNNNNTATTTTNNNNNNINSTTATTPITTTNKNTTKVLNEEKTKQPPPSDTTNTKILHYKQKSY